MRFYLFVGKYYGVQAGFELITLLPSSSSAGITGTYYHTWLRMQIPTIDVDMGL